MVDAEDRGIVFFASGRKFIGHAVQAAHRSMRYNDVPHLIFCSEPPEQTDVAYELFEPTANIWMDRIACFMRSPFQRSLFLDVDCNVLSPVLDLFDLLDVYSVAAAHAPGYRGLDDPLVPPAFFELNCGVIASRKGNESDALYQHWSDLYRTWRKDPPIPGSTLLDQPTFRHAVWTLKIPLYVLGPEYNWRAAFPSFIKNPPKILHGYHENPEAVAADAAARGFGALPPLMPHLTDLSGVVGDVS